jgi:hypothetical protein
VQKTRGLLFLNLPSFEPSFPITLAWLSKLLNHIRESKGSYMEKRKGGCNVVWWCHFLLVSWKTE